ncbi:RFC checkpoint protein Rad17 [Thecaphora frezii]
MPSNANSTPRAKPQQQPRLGFKPPPSSSASASDADPVSIASRSRPLSFTPSFSLAKPQASDKPATQSPVPNPSGSGVDKGRQKVAQVNTEAHQAHVQELDTALWCDKHAPTTAADLAVHKNKVQAVRRWLTESLSGKPGLAKYRRLLVLTGPAGSGKTATLRALSAATELDFELLEWNSQTSLSLSSLSSEPYSLGSSLAERFSDFLARSGRYPSLSMSLAGPSSSRASSGAPGEARHAASLSKRSIDARRPTRRRVILIEDLPNIHHLPTKAAFNAALEQYLARPLPVSPYGLAEVENCPIVLIISENTPKEDDERWAGEASGGGWRERLGAIMDVRTALEETLRRSPTYSEVRFNPVAPTILIKGLRRVVDLEFPTQRSEAMSRSKTQSAPESPFRPSVQTVQAVAESGTGDIRAAINCLQFLCGISAQDQGTKRDAKGKTRSASRSAARSRIAAKQLALISGRESSLALFHAVGRVLYNKRFGDPGQQQEDQKARKRAAGSSRPDVSDDDSDEGSMASLRQRLAQAQRAIVEAQSDEAEAVAGRGSRGNCLPSHYEAFQRRESRVDVQALWTNMPVDPPMFQLYLHQNYPAFTSDIDQCVGIVCGMSDADSMRCTREEYRHAALLSHYNFLVTVHSTLLYLPSPVPRNNQKLAKAAFWEVRNKTREMADLVDDAKQWLMEGRGGINALKLQAVAATTTARGRGPVRPDSDELLDMNRTDAGLGLESYSSLMRSDRQTLSTEILPLLAKIQGSQAGSGNGSPAGSRVPSYFSRITRMRFDWAGISDTAERSLEEHEIEHRFEATGDEEDGPPLSQGPTEAAARLGRSANHGHWRGRAELTAEADEERLYLSDDDIEDF